jgi:hypothetical protein
LSISSEFLGSGDWVLGTILFWSRPPRGLQLTYYPPPNTPRRVGVTKNAITLRYNTLNKMHQLCSQINQHNDLRKETKGRSSRQTPFTIKPKQLAIKKQFLTPQKYFPNLKKKISKNFIFAHEKTALKSCS